MLFTSAQFDKIKEMSIYKDSFDNYENFNNHIDDKLGTSNIVIFVSNILNIMSMYNTGKLDNKSNDTLEIKELIIKANMSQNKDALLHLLGNLNSKDKRIISIDKIIDKELLDNTEEKLDYLIYLEQICKEFYPNFDDKIILSDFHKKKQDYTISSIKKFSPVIIAAGLVYGAFVLYIHSQDKYLEKKNNGGISTDSNKSNEAPSDNNESHQTKQTGSSKDANSSKTIDVDSNVSNVPSDNNESHQTKEAGNSKDANSSETIDVDSNVSNAPSDNNESHQTKEAGNSKNINISEATAVNSEDSNSTLQDNKSL